MPKTSILIADDHEVVIEGIKSSLRDREGFDVIGEALVWKRLGR
jgi:DNA-binding NarL/FixJ family response regulator